ncbi:MAG: hypothetical protein JXR70_00070 [Spirochaetales bacterium]|nr:hypothetical protein [Spirochaetales bacterium]
MNKDKIFFITGTFWETAKTVMLFIIVINRFITEPLFPMDYFIWILPFVASHFLPAIGFLLMLLNEKRFTNMIILIRISKIFNLFTIGFILFSEIYSKPVFLLPYQQLFPLSGIFFFELIFIYFLLSYKTKENISKNLEETSTLPDYTITEVENKVSE